MEARLSNNTFKNLLNRDWKGEDEPTGYKVREWRGRFTFYIFANF